MDATFLFAATLKKEGTIKMSLSPTWMMGGLIVFGLTLSLEHSVRAETYLDANDYSAVRSVDLELESRSSVCLPTKTAIPSEKMTALQRHISFFDFNTDAKVTVAETYRGLRILDIAPPLALPAAITIHVALGTATTGYPSLTLQIPSIEAGMHGSDTGIYDDNGEFDAEKFEAWFTTWDKDRDNALNGKELAERLYKEQDLFDFFGLAASGGEFGALFLLAAQDGKISKERMIAMYQGRLFYDLAHERGIPDCFG